MAEVRALEGRWDLIEDYLSTLTEAEDSIFPVAESAGVRED